MSCRTDAFALLIPVAVMSGPSVVTRYSFILGSVRAGNSSMVSEVPYDSPYRTITGTTFASSGMASHFGSAAESAGRALNIKAQDTVPYGLPFG